MQEIELKFQVQAASRAAVAAEVAGADKPPRTRLQAAYFDTPERALAEAGLALRVRREGRRWVQTLKGAAADGMTRAEHNVPRLAAAGTLPAVDPALHAGTPAGDRLLALLAKSNAELVCLYRTDIWRRTRRLSVPGRTGDAAAGGTVELAFDEGVILAGERRLAVCEFEIELMEGSALAVLDTAAQWVPRHRLWLDTRSKAERGSLLARGERMSPARGALPVGLHGHPDQSAALRAVLLSCFDQISVNASQVASADFSAEHLHQLRVGLRRLRTALRLFAVMPSEGEPDLGELAATLFRRLGAARDADAITQPLTEALAAALRSVGLDDAPPTLPGAEAEAPADSVRGAEAQMLLLGLLHRVQAATGDVAAKPLRRLTDERLERWHRQLRRDAKRFAELDDEARHRMRKRVKRLRYAIEFVSGAYPKKAVAAVLKPLRALQQRLGALTDAALAIEAFRGASRADPRALFALGWLASQREALLADAARAMHRFVDSKRPWKQR